MLHTFKKMQKDEYHQVPGVLLYSFHFASQRETESCIDEMSGEVPELHFLLALWLQRNSWASGGTLHDSPLHTEAALCHWDYRNSWQKYFILDLIKSWELCHCYYFKPGFFFSVRCGAVGVSPGVVRKGIGCKTIVKSTARVGPLWSQVTGKGKPFSELNFRGVLNHLKMLMWVSQTLAAEHQNHHNRV